MKLLNLVIPRFREQDADLDDSSQQQIAVIKSLTECKLRLASHPRLAALDAEVRARRAAHDEPE